MENYLYLSIAIAGGVLGTVGFIISLICVAMIAGFVRSTHTVQYLPVDPPGEPEKSPEEIEAEETKELLDKVGKKKKKEGPSVFDDLHQDKPLEEIVRSDINF